MNRHNNHVLVIADKKSEAATLVDYLQQLEYPVSVITTTQPVNQLFAVKQPDLIIFKTSFPQPTIDEFLAQLKAHPDWAIIPLLALTDQSNQKHREHLFELGLDDYLLEPSSPTLLGARIAHHLRFKQLRDQKQAELREMEKLAADLKQVVLPLGVALSTEKDPDHLLERILLETRSICNADAGLLYLRTEDDLLRLALRRSIPLTATDDNDEVKTTLSPPLRMYDKQSGAPNYSNVATCAALNNHSINIPDIYTAQGFDFSGTKDFDRTYNYRTISILAIPLKNPLDEVIGVFELINAKDSTTGQVIPFDAYHQLVAESLTSLATVALNYQGLLIERDNMLAALQARMAELRTIHQIGQTISSSVDLDKTLSYILSSIQSVIAFDGAEICLPDQAGDKMVCRIAYPPLAQESGEPDQTLETDMPMYDPKSGYIGHIIQKGQSILVANIATHHEIQMELDRTWSNLKPQGYLGVPLKANNQVIGIIELVCQQAAAFNQENLHLLESIAMQASVAIQNAREVESREQKLKQTIQELRIQIDTNKQQAEVEQIINSDYFQTLSTKAKQLRDRPKPK